MSWKILGISDEVETCERCGKTNLKRTVVLTDGECEMYVGTECASRMMGRDGSYVNSKAKEVQYEADKERSRSEWSTIMNSMHYKFLKNQVHALGSARDEDKIRKGYECVVEQSGLSAACVMSHLRSRWNPEKLVELEGR